MFLGIALLLAMHYAVLANNRSGRHRNRRVWRRIFHPTLGLRSATAFGCFDRFSSYIYLHGTHAVWYLDSAHRSVCASPSDLSVIFHPVYSNERLTLRYPGRDEAQAFNIRLYYENTFFRGLLPKWTKHISVFCVRIYADNYDLVQHDTSSPAKNQAPSYAVKALPKDKYHYHDYRTVMCLFSWRNWGNISM